MNILPIKRNYDNTFETISRVLDLLNIKYSEGILIKKITDHPIYASLLSISDILNDYQVDNASMISSVNQIKDLPVPFIVQTHSRVKDSFTVVKSVIENDVEYFDMDFRNWKSIPISDFDTLWKNKVVMIINGDDSKGEINYRNNLIYSVIETIVRIAILGILPMTALFEATMSIQIFGLLGIKFAIIILLFLLGTVLAANLFWIEISENYTILRQICQPTKRINCAAVLQSKVAKPLGIPLSIWGLSYFLGCLTSLILCKPWHKELLFLLSWTSVISSAMILFSIYYQFFYLKQWCLLCLYVQGILMTILMTNIWGGWLFISKVDVPLLLSTIFVLGSSLGCSISLICLVRYMYKVLSENSSIKRELNKLKFDPSTFSSQLSNQLVLTQSVDKIGIILGNPKAKHQLIKVCDPFCSHCARSHRVIRSLIEENLEINVKLIFTSSTDPKDLRYNPVKHFMELFEYGNTDILNEALDYWYLSEDKNIDTLITKFSIPRKSTNQQQEIEKMHKWCTETEISFTPTFYLNGKKLPELYSIEDLKYVIY